RLLLLFRPPGPGNQDRQRHVQGSRRARAEGQDRRDLLRLAGDRDLLRELHGLEVGTRRVLTGQGRGRRAAILARIISGSAAPGRRTDVGATRWATSLLSAAKPPETGAHEEQPYGRADRVQDDRQREPGKGDDPEDTGRHGQPRRGPTEGSLPHDEPHHENP